MMDGPFARRNGALVQEALLGFAEAVDGRLAEFQSSKHVDFRDLLGAGLDHGDEVLAAGDGQVQVAGLRFLVRGVHDEVARLGVAAHANARHRTLERSIGQHQRGGSTCHAQGVGLVLAVDHKRGGDHMDFLLEALCEHGADGTVNHARRQRALVACLALALQIAAGNAAHGVQLLHVVHGQREEVIILLLVGDDGGHQAGGIALGDQDGAACLLGKLAGLEAVLLAVQLEALNDFFHAK